MPFVLQPDTSENPTLLEAIVRTTDHATCNNVYGIVTNNMICTLPHSGYKGPCYVRYL